MAKRLLAMVACEVTHASPWFNSKGTENCAKVIGMGSNDIIALQFEHEGQIFVRNIENGINILTQGAGQRFRIVKDSGQPSVPTTVEIFY